MSDLTLIPLVLCAKQYHSSCSVAKQCYAMEKSHSALNVEPGPYWDFGADTNIEE